MTKDAKNYIDSMIEYNANAYNTIYNIGLIEGVEIVKNLTNKMLEEASENDDMSKITQLNEALTIFLDNIVITKSPDLDDNNDKEDDEYKIPDDLPNDIDSEVDENE